MSTNLVEMHLD